MLIAKAKPSYASILCKILFDVEAISRESYTFTLRPFDWICGYFLPLINHEKKIVF